MRLVALALVVVACGDNLEDPGTPHSGQRLKLGWWVYEDSTRQRETTWYYDAALATRCTPAAWSDGHRYCAPESDAAVFVSDTCTRALGRVPQGTTPRPFLTTRFYLDGEGAPSRVFRTGAAASAPLAVWEKHHNGCFGPMPPGDFDYYELGEEITADRLPRLRRGQPRGDGLLAVLDELGDDGLRVPIGWYDRERQVECTTAAGAHAPRVECVPDDSVLASYFHDVECTGPIVSTSQPVAGVIARQYSMYTRCWRYFNVGEPVAAPPLYEAIGRLCVPVSPPGGQRFYLVGAPAELPAIDRLHTSGPGRMQRIERVHGELRVDDELVFDGELEADCRRDDQQRCVPATEVMVLPFFRDSLCELPMELAIVPAGECDAWTPYARKGDDYYPLLAEYIHDIFVPSTGDTCSRYAPEQPFAAWVVGEPLDPSRFARAELQIDP